MRGPVWTASNALSILRLLLVIPISVLLSSEEENRRLFALALIIVAVGTDIFDGLLARRLGQVTEFGKLVDPLADKVAVGVVTTILTLQGRIPLWFLVAVLFRDVAIFAGGIYIRTMKGVVLQSNFFGKLTVIVIAVFIVVSVIDSPVLSGAKDALMFLSLLLLTGSFAFYVQRFISIVLLNKSVTQG